MLCSFARITVSSRAFNVEDHMAGTQPPSYDAVLPEIDAFGSTRITSGSMVASES